MDSPKRSTAAVPSLPDDALVEILSGVPAKSLCRFKCASKAWRDLITDRHHRKRLPQTLEGFFLHERHGGTSDDDGNDEGDGDGGRWDPIRQGLFIDTLGRSMPLPSFSFLGELPAIEKLTLIDSCNGLFLFGHGRDSEEFNSLGYVVCNPTTEQWVAVPSSSRKPFPPDESKDSDLGTKYYYRFTNLIFDPAVSSHFQLVEFWMDGAASVEEVHTYSSETGVWCTSEWSSDEAISFTSSAFVRGMLHFSVTSFQNFDIHKLIVAVDREGNRRRIIRGPEKHGHVVFVGQSQGRLHWVNRQRDYTRKMAELSIWVLQDYDKEEWALKHSVTFMQLFGRMSCEAPFEYRVVAIHPDRNLIFYVQHWDLKLKSYDMDSKEVCTLRILKVGPQNIYPYVPYFVESSSLANKH